jgi:hypothetical protein
MGQYQYRPTVRQGKDGSTVVTKRKGRRLWLEPELSDAEWDALATDLCRDVRDALNARDSVIGEGQLLDYCDWLYEQGQTPSQDLNKPWGADLNSYLVTEAVDSEFARLVQAAFPKQEPICTVGGWGPSAKQKAPIVEEFLDFTFRQEEPDAQLSTALAIFQSLLEDAGILEVTEGYEVKSTVEDIAILPQLDEQGGLMLDAKNQPIPTMDPDTGEPVKQTDPNGHAINAKYRQVKPRLTGPQYDVISLRDFLFLPGHAKNKQELWGYAKRFWRRVSQLQEKVEAGIYEGEEVETLGTQSERTQTQGMSARGVDVAPQYDETAEKELWEVYFKRDLDGDGYEEWYCATISTIDDVMIRLVLDDFGRPRCLPVIPFPRRDSVYGYNFTATKMASIAEEHAALRNTATDRSTLASNPPLMKIEGGAWDPDVEPMGTGRTITVRTKDEVTPMVLPDVPMSNVDLRRECFAAKERVTGVNDVSGSSVSNTQPGTATRDTLIAQAGAVRIETALNFLREFLADLWEIRRLIWQRKLASEQHGMSMSHGLVDRLVLRGIDGTDTITADDLNDRFYFKPVGSVASADPARRRVESAQAFMALGQFAQMNPLIQQVLATPEAALAIMMTWARDNDVPDKQAFVAPLRKLIQAQAQQAQMPQNPFMAPQVPPGQPAAQPPINPMQALLRGSQGQPPPTAPMPGRVQ